MPVLTATVIANKEIATVTREVILETPSPFVFQPGQYITILVPTDHASLGKLPEGVKGSVPRKIGRSYSIASEPSDTRIVLTVKIVPGGLGSTYIDAWQEGDRVEFLGPLGRFLLPSPPLQRGAGLPSDLSSKALVKEEALAKDGGIFDYLFVATGAGIAPFVPMIDTLLHHTDDEASSMGTPPLRRGVGGISSPRVTLLLGFRHEQDSFYADRFSAWEKEHDNFRFIHCLSRPSDAWQGEKGRVTTYMREHPELAENARIYICGNGSMITDVSAIAAEQGVPRERIFFEKYNNL